MTKALKVFILTSIIGLWVGYFALGYIVYKLNWAVSIHNDALIYLLSNSVQTVPELPTAEEEHRL